jgi:hypothetical protein
MTSRSTFVHALSSLLMFGALAALPAACADAPDDLGDLTEEEAAVALSGEVGPLDGVAPMGEPPSEAPEAGSSPPKGAASSDRAMPVDDPMLEEFDAHVDPTMQAVAMERVVPAGAAPDQPAASDQVVPYASLPNLCGALYDDEKMQGGQTNMTRNQTANANRRVTALAIAPNCTIKLTRDGRNAKNFVGGSAGRYVYNVGRDANDWADTAECTCSAAPQLAAMLYEDANYGGNSVPVWENIRGGLWYFWNDRVTSVQTQPGSQIVLFDGSPPSGRTYTRSGTSSGNVGRAFNDRASYFTSGGTYWPACAPLRFCAETSDDCSGIGRIAPDMVECFQARNHSSYCQEAVNGSVCIPRWATPF